ncbi:MAG: hypothetical protein LBU47_07390 [Christensenellaceae bacterium]|jgi:beta-fructofuranosidase|nr:hypothetical protein [Christensenellaceae bacterium]
MAGPKIVFQPEGYDIGDAMPFYEGGSYFLYHYKTDQAQRGRLQGWTLSETRDLVAYEDHGVQLPFGKEGEKDRVFRSGSLFKGQDGLYHLLYGADDGGEFLQLASGKALDALQKTDFILGIPEGYGPAEFRDPCVFWSEELRAYVMAVGTRKAEGKRLLNGCVVWFTSKDLQTWAFQGDLFASGAYTTLEMPDLFKLGQWWILLFSEYSDRTQVVYRMARSMTGPWLCPDDDALDAAAYFAAKSAEGPEGRVLFGWVAGKSSEDDRGAWNASSGILPHLLFQREDGSLGVRMPQSARDAFQEGKCLKTPEISAPYTREEAFLGEAREGTHLLELEIEIEPGTRAFSLSVAGDEESRQAYEFRFLVKQNRVEFSASPNHGIWPPDHFRGMERLERLLPLEGKASLKLALLRDESYFCLYAEGAALSGRIYEPKGCAVFAAAANGKIRVKSAELFTLKA